MEILSSLKPKLKSIGLMYSEKLSFWYRVYGYFWLLMVFLVILPEVSRELNDNEMLYQIYLFPNLRPPIL